MDNGSGGTKEALASEDDNSNMQVEKYLIVINVLREGRINNNGSYKKNDMQILYSKYSIKIWKERE
eukprot:6688957-Ditylum_brightwellii.AAC.1